MEKGQAALSFENFEFDIFEKGTKKISGSIEPGKILALMGPSGCGKSTLLNHLAGLLSAKSGECYLSTASSKTALSKIPTENRRVAYVQQSAALFPHLSVYENLRFALRFREPFKMWSEDLKKARITEWLSKHGLENLAQKMPSQLSGGEAHRIAFLRALIAEPDYALLDEPFSALDSQTKEGFMKWAREVLLASKIPTLYVTHLEQEAQSFADKTLQWPLHDQELRL